MPYDAFISYSHAVDNRLAPAIQTGLQRLAKPWNRRRALWIFRDNTSLSANPALWSSIKAALDDSRYLIVLLSPGAAASPWVKREVSYWIATKSAQHILLVLTDGEWAWDTQSSDFESGRSTAMIPALREVFVEEPRFLDLRWARSERQLDLTVDQFRDAIAELAAPLHGKSREDIDSEDLRQHRRASRIRVSASATLAILTALALVAGGVAWKNSRRATAAAASARTQQAIAQDQQRRAEQAAAEARTQQRNAEQARAEALTQQRNAERAAAEAVSQKRNAERAAAEAVSQQRNAERAAAEAVSQKRNAEQARAVARTQQRNAERAAAEALTQKRNAERAAAEALNQQRRAEAQAELAMSRQLAAQAELKRDDDLALSLLLSVEAVRFASTVEARSALLAGLQADPGLTTFLRSGPPAVTGFALTSDGRMLASGDSDGRVTLVDVPSHRPVGQLSARAGAEISSLSFSPDGGTLAVGGSDGRIVLWSVHTRQPIGGPLSSHTKPVSSLAFGKDGRLLASADNKKIVLWDVTARAQQGRSLTGLNQGTTEIGGRVSLAFSPHGDVLASGDTDGSVVLWSLRTHRPVGRRLSTLDAGVDTGQVSLAFSPNGTTLAAGVDASCDLCDDEPGKIILWDVKSQQPIGAPLTGHLGGVNSVDFSPDGRLLSSGGTRDGAILLWDLKARQPLRSPLTAHKHRAVSAAFASSSRSIVSADSDGNIVLWDTRRQVSPGTVLEGDGRQVGSVAFSPDGQLLASSDETKSEMTVRDLRSRRVILRSSGGARSLVFSHSGRLLAQVTTDGTVVLWDMASRQQLGRSLDPDTAVRAVAFTADDKILISAEQSSIVLRDARSGRRLGSPLVAHSGEVESVVTSPDGELFATGGDDGLVVLWSTRTWQPVERPLDTHDAVSSVAFSPDGKLLASYGISGQIILLDVRSRRPEGASMSGPAAAEASGVSGTFSPDNRMFASAGDQRIVIWDVQSHRPLGAPLTYLDTQVTTIAFRPSGGWLASGYGDGTIVLWDTDPQTWRDRACAIANRSLSRSEWNQYVGAIKAYRRTCG